MTPEYRALLQEFESLREQATHSFKAQALLLLRENQEGSGVVAMRWLQFAPHFNDGDTCTFEVQSCAQFRCEGEEGFLNEDLPPWGDTELEKESEDFLSSVHPEVLYQLFGTDVIVTVSIAEGEAPFSVSYYGDHH